MRAVITGVETIERLAMVTLLFRGDVTCGSRGQRAAYTPGDVPRQRRTDRGTRRRYHRHLTATPATSRQADGTIQIRRGTVSSRDDERLSSASTPRPTPAPIAPKITAP